MKVIRLVASLFTLILIALSVTGWVWTGAHQPSGQATASRIVLTLGALAGVAGIVAIWRWPHRS